MSNGDENGDGELVLSWRLSPRGRPIVEARRGGELVLSERCDLHDGAARERCARRLHAVASIPPAEALRRLLCFADEASRAADAPAGNAATAFDEPLELDSARVVRPERFIVSEVSGLTVPVVSARGDDVVAQWKLYLRWADGRREVVTLPRAIALPGGDRLWIHPTPSDPTPSTRPGWSASSRRAWLNGEPAPSAADVFQAVTERLAYFIDLPRDDAPGLTAMLACWTIVSYAYCAWQAVPYLFIGGALGSGKTRVFEVLARIVFRPLASSNLSAPAMFRTLHDGGGTLLLDESERLRDSHDPGVAELLSMLLAGYKRGGTATRLEPVGDRGFRTVSFDVFGPKAMACIAGLPPALASRCIPITMLRAAPDSPKPKRRIDSHPERWERLRDDLHALSLERGSDWLDLAQRADVCPPGLAGRDWELWQPILAVAAMVEDAGARGLLRLLQDHCLRAIDAGREDQTPHADELLLKALVEALRAGERPRPADLLARVRESDPESFKRWTPRAVGEHLRRYGVTTTKTRGERRYVGIAPADLARVERNYGVDLGIDSTTVGNVPPRTPCTPENP